MNIADLNPDPERVESFKKGIYREYEKYSIIGEPVKWRPFRPDDQGDFVKVGQRVLVNPDVLVSKRAMRGVYVHPEILGLGTSVAYGEEEYLIEQLQKSSQPKHLITIDAMMRILKESGLRLDLAFIPNTHRRALHRYSDPLNMRYAKVAGNRIRVFWSNKYVKFDKLLFLAHDSVEWIVKPDPDTNHRLEIQIKYDGNRDRFDVILQTIASLRIVDPARVLCFELG